MEDKPEYKQRPLDAVLFPPRHPEAVGLHQDKTSGVLDVKISAANGCVVFDMGQAVWWFAMPPALARSVAAALLAKADELEGK